MRNPTFNSPSYPILQSITWRSQRTNGQHFRPEYLGTIGPTGRESDDNESHNESRSTGEEQIQNPNFIGQKDGPDQNKPTNVVGTNF